MLINGGFFITQLEKAREATDAANLRAAYAEVMVAGLNEDSGNYEKTVKLTQKQSGWQDTSITDIGGVSTSTDATLKGVDANQTIKVTYTPASGSTAASVTFSK